MQIITMPQLGISEESAILTEWHIKQGEYVNVGDKLFSIETGKSAFDVESEHAGTLLALFAEEGDEVAVKAQVCAIGAVGDAVPSVPSAVAVINSEQITDNSEQIPPVGAASAPPIVNCSLLTVNCQGVSPRAKNLAEKMGVDPSQAIPTGPDGRVIERDIRQLTVDSGQWTVGRDAPGAPFTTSRTTPTAEYTDRTLSNIRKIIAKNMMASLQNTAQLTHTASFDVSNILACRKRFKNDPAMSGITLGDIILYAVSRTLKDFPELNAHLLDNTLRVFNEVNLAVAVDTERGLMVPVIFNASQKTLPEISSELKILAEQCRSGSISVDRLSGGSFTVSNLGQFGIESFTPILNAPQTGILGVNTIQQRVRVVDGCIGAYPCMTLSLTYDHRALDGAPASRFLQTLCGNLENFEPLGVL
ncbi:MAG: 2-oxo acid dehydrogenase subunit E2 [Oscillospiraceae bacterium]|nr:2-oxo acid dehydrogenase subunit E2 [Oscillospiraceae bacterium]